MLIERDMTGFSCPSENRAHYERAPSPSEHEARGFLPQTQLQLVEHEFLARTGSVPVRPWRNAGRE